MKNYKSQLPITLTAIWVALAKVDWWKVFQTIQKVKKIVAIFKAIASYATPEEKAQLEEIYLAVLDRAIKDKVE